MKRRLLVLAVAAVLGNAAAVEIQVPREAPPGLLAAAQDLRDVVARMGDFSPRIRPAGDVAAPPVLRLEIQDDLQPQEWRVASVADGVVLAGGSVAGVHFAVSHYLEDECGVRFWTPYEDYVPQRDALPVAGIERRGAPAFDNRNIYASYGQDGGRFALRRRLNGNGDEGFDPKYGLARTYGPPYFTHTLHDYLPAERYFKDHPEWYAFRDGKRLGPDTGVQRPQPCLSNKDMRAAIVERLKGFVASAAETAQKNGLPPPRIFDISQNDNQQYCRCDACQAIVDRHGGAQASIMLDFINEIADAVKDDYPDILLTTFAYQYTEKPPTGIVPRDNVIVVLTDTLSNAALPLTPKDNAYFVNLMEAWSLIAPNIRIWDYAVTFQRPIGLPYASETTYANDARFFRDSGVMQMFIEMEYPDMGDARDFKYWMLSHFLENPDADADAIARDFVEGFYGPAAEVFLRYRQRLSASQREKNPHLAMYPSASAFTHLDLATLADADALMREGEQLLAGDEARLKRWRQVRLTVDRAIAARRRALMLEYRRARGNLDGYPFADLAPAIERIRRAWTEQAELRFAAGKPRTQTLETMEKELADYAAPINEKALVPPERFRDTPPEKMFDFTMEAATRWQNIVKLVDDPDAESGTACRFGFPNEGGEKHTVDKYPFPIVWAIYSPALKKNLRGADIRRPAGPGYHWYAIKDTKLSADAKLFWFWSWYIQLDIGEAFDPNDENALYDVWMRMKFTGPAYGGKADEPDAISLERVIVVRQ